MRSTFVSLVANHSYDRIASALAQVDVELDFDVTEWLLRALTDPWSSGSLSSGKLRNILDGSPAGLFYARMLEEKEKVDAARRAHKHFNSPEEINRRRAEKKKIKAEAHQRRLASKASRDAAYFASLKGAKE